MPHQPVTPEKLIIARIGASLDTKQRLDFMVDQKPNIDDLKATIQDYILSKFGDKVGRYLIDDYVARAEPDDEPEEPIVVNRVDRYYESLNDDPDEPRPFSGPATADDEEVQGSVFGISVTKPTFVVYSTEFDNWYFRRADPSANAGTPGTNAPLPPMTPKSGKFNKEHFDDVEIISGVQNGNGQISNTKIREYGIMVKKAPPLNSKSKDFEFDIHMAVYQDAEDAVGNTVKKMTKIIIDPKLRNP